MKQHKVKTIYDDLKSQNKFLKIIVGVQVCIVVLALLTNVKPPIVIRETDNGAHVMTDYQGDSFVSELDVELFFSTFVKKFNLVDSFSIYENIPDALSMMDPKLEDHYKTKVITADLVKSIIDSKNRTITTIKSIDSKKEGSIVPATITYERQVISFESGEKIKIVVRGEAILEIVERTVQYPYGLKVREYKEIKLS
mgnify:FL=1